MVRKYNIFSVKSFLLMLLIATSTYCIVYHIITPNKLTENTVLYLSSAILQAYAALIAIPFAIAAIHLQSKYGYISANILLNRIKPVLIIYIIIAIFSVFSLVLSQRRDFLIYIIITLVIIALVPVWYIIKYLEDIILLKPADIMHGLGYPDTPATLLAQGKVYDAWNILHQGLELARCCLLDPALHAQASIVISQIAESIQKINWSSEVREDRPTGSLDVSGLLFNILWSLSSSIIDPIRNSTVKPNPISIIMLIKEINKALIESMKGYSQIFDNFLEVVCILVILYYETHKDLSWEILKSVLFTTKDYIKQQNNKANVIKEYILPRILCCSLKIYLYIYKNNNIVQLNEFTDFNEIKLDLQLYTFLSVLKEYPTSLFHMLCLEDLLEAIEKSSKTNITILAQTLEIFALCDYEKSKLQKNMYERAQYILDIITREIKKIVDENKYKIKLENKYFKIVDEENKCTGIVEIDSKNIKVLREYITKIIQN